METIDEECLQIHPKACELPLKRLPLDDSRVLMWDIVQIHHDVRERFSGAPECAALEIDRFLKKNLVNRTQSDVYFLSLINELDGNFSLYIDFSGDEQLRRIREEDIVHIHSESDI